MTSYRESIERMLEKIVTKILRYDRISFSVDSNPLKVTLVELWILRELGKQSASIQELTERFDLNRDLVSRSIQQLERNAMVEKETVEGDRRIRRIHLSAAGQELLKSWNHHEKDHFDYVLADMTVNEQKAVLKFLSRINQLTVGKYDLNE
jgi:DNA-binding MarR family transcriptional regulator